MDHEHTMTPPAPGQEVSCSISFCQRSICSPIASLVAPLKVLQESLAKEREKRKQEEREAADKEAKERELRRREREDHERKERQAIREREEHERQGRRKRIDE